MQNGLSTSQKLKGLIQKVARTALKGPCPAPHLTYECMDYIHHFIWCVCVRMIAFLNVLGFAIAVSRETNLFHAVDLVVSNVHGIDKTMGKTCVRNRCLTNTKRETLHRVF